MVGLYPIVGDILHAGHLMAIKEAKRNCDYLIVALNTKPDGKNPVQSVFERFIQLRAVKYIDELIVYEGREDLELIASAYDYELRFIGEDYRGKIWDGKSQEQNRGIKSHYLSRKHNLSSTQVKNRIKEQK